MSSFKAAFISAGNDYFAALERVAGDTELLSELMQMFVEDKNYYLMKHALAEGETEKAFRAAHSLKGSCGMLGMTALFDAMVRITDELRVGKLNEAKAIYPEVECEYKRIVDLLGKYL